MAHAINPGCGCAVCSQKGPRPLAERFWEKVEKTEFCWLWHGSLHPKGYGQLTMRVDGKTVGRRAHHVAWELAYGSRPKGLNICHHCDVRNCVRPSHLFAGTQKENIQDMIRKGRHRTRRQGASLGV